MQLVEQGALGVIEYAEHQQIVVLLKARTIDAGKEACFFVDAGRMPLHALAAVIEDAPARQVGALERTQGDRRGLQVQQMAAQHGP